jgi:hypothetical protein
VGILGGLRPIRAMLTIALYLFLKKCHAITVTGFVFLTPRQPIRFHV